MTKLIKLMKHELGLRKISVFKLGIAAVIVNVLFIIGILASGMDIAEIIRLSVADEHEAMGALLPPLAIALLAFSPVLFVIDGLLLLMPLLNAILAFRRDVFGKERYLIFSLPVKGAQIIGARMAVACLDYGAALLLFGVLTVGIVAAFLGGSFVSAVGSFTISNLPLLLLNLASALLEFALFIMVMYFIIIIISKAVRNVQKGRRVLGIVLGVMLFNVVLNIKGAITQGIQRLMPAFQINVNTSAFQAFFADFNDRYLQLPYTAQCGFSLDLPFNPLIFTTEIILLAVLFKIVVHFADKRLEV